MFSTRFKKTLTNTAILLPPIFTFCLIYKFGLRIPYWDQWELVPILEKLHNNTVTLADLWQQHNEHRIIFPKILMLLLAYFSNWNIFLELCTNIVLAALSLSLLFSILRNTSESIKAPWLKIIISLLIFSMIQYENWSWGWQIQIFMSVLGTIIAIWSANKWQGKTIGLAIAISAAILSSYSFNVGLVTWPALAALLLLQKNWRLRHIIILTIACIATVSLYYYKYTKCSYHPPILFFLSHPLIYIRYVLTYLGSPLGHTHSSSLLMAVFLLIITPLAVLDIWRFNKEQFKKLAPWLTLALYTCLAACATGVGRAGLGWQQALSGRYTTISVMLTVSAAVIISHSIELHLSINKKRYLKDTLFIIAITSVFFVSFTTSYYQGTKKLKERSKYINESAFCLTNPEIADEDSLKRLYPSPDIIMQRIKTLSDLGIKFKTVE